MNDPTKLLKYTKSKGNINISTPINAPDSINSVIVIDVSGVPVAAK